MECQKCKKRWPEDCEQSISIELYGECFGCKFSPRHPGSSDGTEAEADEISEEWRKRHTNMVEELGIPKPDMSEYFSHAGVTLPPCKPPRQPPEPPEPPPMRLFRTNLIGREYETKESKQRTRDWENYTRGYSAGLAARKQIGENYKE